MHILRHMAAPALLLASSIVVTSAQAQTFGAVGEIFRPTCTFAVDDVDLGEHTAAGFTGVGYETGWQRFDIRSTGCSGGTFNLSMRWNGTVDTNNSNLYAFTGGTGAGVGVEIQTFNNQRAGPNGNTINGWPAGGIAGVYEHKARLVQTLPTVTAGTGRASVTVTVTYP